MRVGPTSSRRQNSKLRRERRHRRCHRHNATIQESEVSCRKPITQTMGDANLCPSPGLRCGALGKAPGDRPTKGRVHRHGRADRSSQQSNHHNELRQVAPTTRPTTDEACQHKRRYKAHGECKYHKPCAREVGCLMRQSPCVGPGRSHVVPASSLPAPNLNSDARHQPGHTYSSPRPCGGQLGSGSSACGHCL